MAHRVDVVDADDDRVADYVRLRDATLRRHLDVDRGIFIAEGHKVITRALSAGMRPRSLLLTERWLPGIEPLIDAEVPVYVVSQHLAEEITGFHVHRGALGAFERPIPRDASTLLGADRVVVLEDIVDHANVGACFRSAAGLGWDGVFIAPQCADPLYRRSIKVSMGAVLDLPWVRFERHDTAVAVLREAGFTVAALALTPRAVPLADFAARMPADGGRIALLLGTEGHGLSESWLRAADVVVTIPMHAGVDSLNVAAASAVACYQLGPR